jgi:fructokinase
MGQAMAAWTCEFEGARGGMYEVDKESFKATIGEMISETTIDNSRRAVRKVKRANRRKGSICPACDQSDGRHSASKRA